MSLWPKSLQATPDGALSSAFAVRVTGPAWLSLIVRNEMSTQKKSNGREIAEELFTPGYFDSARQRATRRKSRWNLLLLPSVMLGIGSVVFFIVRLADLYLGYRG